MCMPKGYMGIYTHKISKMDLRADAEYAACTPGSAPGPTLVIESLYLYLLLS